LCAFHSVIWILFHRVFVMSINVAKTNDFNLLYQEIYLLERPSRANYVVGKAWRQGRYWNKECAQGRAVGRFWILVTALSEGLNARNLELLRNLMKCKNSAKNPAKNIKNACLLDSCLDGELAFLQLKFVNFAKTITEKHFEN